MPFFSRQTKETVDTLREQGKSAVFHVRSVIIHAAEHLRALSALFGVELQEYAARQTSRLIALAAGIFLTVCGYLILCALVCALIGSYIGILWGMAIVCAAHFLAAGTLIILALNHKPGPLAPATRQELKNDLQCLQIILGSKKENC